MPSKGFEGPALRGNGQADVNAAGDLLQTEAPVIDQRMIPSRFSRRLCATSGPSVSSTGLDVRLPLASRCPRPRRRRFAPPGPPGGRRRAPSREAARDRTGRPSPRRRRRSPGRAPASRRGRSGRHGRTTGTCRRYRGAYGRERGAWRPPSARTSWRARRRRAPPRIAPRTGVGARIRRRRPGVGASRPRRRRGRPWLPRARRRPGGGARS